MARFLSMDLVDWAGRQRPIHDIPLRSTECDGRKFMITCEELNTERSNQIVTWRPVKLKQ